MIVLVVADDRDVTFNTTWSEESDIIIPNVTRAAGYDVTLYLRAKDREDTEASGETRTLAPVDDSIYLNVSVEFIPMVPWTLTAIQVNPHLVALLWRLPYFHNSTMVVSMSPSSPAYSVAEEALGQHVIRYPFVHGTNYTFTVAIEEPFDPCLGNASHVHLTIDANLIGTVNRLQVVDTGSSWAHLNWEPTVGTNDYMVRIESDNPYDQHPVIRGVHPVSATEVSCNVTGLSPGTGYYFYVTGYRGESTGEAAMIGAGTQGETLPAVNIFISFLVSGVPTAINLFWIPPNHPRVEWEYAVFYGTSEAVIHVQFPSSVGFFFCVCWVVGEVVWRSLDGADRSIDREPESGARCNTILN